MPEPRARTERVVVVSDAEQRSALAVIRSLGRGGYRVITCSASNGAIGGASRYSSAHHRVPAPLTDGPAFAAAMAGICRSERASLVLPVTDASTLALIENASALEGVALPFPVDERFSKLSDKAQLLAHAAEMGISVPRMSTIQAPDSIDIARLDELRYPVVLKPARSISGDGISRRKITVSYASDSKELRAALGRIPDQAFPVMVQQKISGPGVGVFLLRRGGMTRAAFSHRRIREKPPTGGVCVLGESRALDPVLVRMSEELLQAHDWDGVAMVEYKQDELTGEYYLMEVNARFWGSLQLAVDSGVDFPILLADSVLGLADNTALIPPSYRAGVRTRWFWGDVDNLVATLRRKSHPGSDAGVEMERAPLSRLSAILAFLAAFGPRNRNEVLRLTDPVPAVIESLNWILRRS